jgi:methionyl-tRNA formyltransferase
MTMTSATQQGVDGLRVVLFCVLPPVYGMLREWTARHNHNVRLVVTTPGPSTRRSAGYREIVAMSPPEQDILVSTHPRRLAAQIAPHKPDLILSATFPYRIPPEVTAIPRFGAVNLHPTPLPLYRGPNPLRLFYDASPVLGVTLHRTEEDFDTGVIYSRQERPMPEDASIESLLPVWTDAMVAALEEGTARAIAGEPGVPQDHTRATYGAPFTEEEQWLDWNLPARLLQCRVTALTFADHAHATIDGTPYEIDRVTPLVGVPAAAAPGTVLARNSNVFTVATSDGVVLVTTTV